MLVYPIFQAIENLIEYITADKRTREIIRSVPYSCRYCELLGICRDESNGWKCRRGCLVMPEKPFVPYRCQKCERLKECRDEENNMKCRRGCLIINEERESSIKQWETQK